eukprot:52073-Eustigmatos_ZCMA.PRE.1
MAARPLTNHGTDIPVPRNTDEALSTAAYPLVAVSGVTAGVGTCARRVGIEGGALCHSTAQLCHDLIQRHRPPEQPAHHVGEGTERPSSPYPRTADRVKWNLCL